MDRTRRDFIASTAAFAATTLAADSALAAESAARDGRAAITKAESDAMDVAISKGGFTCVRTAESGDGPYYYESSLRRSDVTKGRRGLPLKLGVRVLNATAPAIGCSPLGGAIVDLWQADADGMYSNVGSDLQNENYRTHGEMTAPGAKGTIKRIHNTEDMVFNGDGSRPLQIQRAGKLVTAQASIGVVTLGGRGVKSLFR